MARKKAAPAGQASLITTSGVRAALDTIQRTGGNVMSLQGLPDKVLRKTYTEMRDIAQKRLKRLEASQHASNAEVQRIRRQYPEGFKKLSQISSEKDPKKYERDLLYQMKALDQFLNNKYLSIKGLNSIRDKQLESLHKHGFGWINKKNYDQFVKFMDYLRDRYNGRMPPSDLVVDDFLKENMDPKAKNIEYLKDKYDNWLDEQEQGYL